MKKRRVLFIALIGLLVVSMVQLSLFAKTKVKLNKTKVTLTVGQTKKLKVKNKPKGAKVKWSSKNKKVAKVTKKGKVIAKKTGKTTIIAKVKKKKLKCKVIVKKKTTKKNVTPTAPFETTKQAVTTKPVPKKQFKIIYELNGGINSEKNPSVYTSGDKVVLEEPTKDNYSFVGWFLDKNFKTKIETLDSDFDKDEITLYAKYHLKALNINQEGFDDMIWSWWYHPQVISDDSQGMKVFWGYATKDGYCGVSCFDDSTNKANKTVLKKANSVDDHNGLALTLLDDKRIMCSYAGGHNTDNEIHIRISDNPLDVKNFSKEVVLESVGKTCYSQFVKNKDTYYLFYRVNNNSWAYRTTKDGVNWTDEVVLVKASMQYYCRFVPTTDDKWIRVIMYSNPTATAPEIREGFLNTEDNYLYNSDRQERLQSKNNSYDTLKVLLNVDEGKTQRLFDVCKTKPEETRFLFTKFTAKKNTNDCQYFMYDKGNTIKICDGGKPLWDPKYQLGASFIDNDTITIGRNNGNEDCIEVYKYNGTSFEKTNDVYSEKTTNGVRNARPIADVNGKAILWHNGYYNPDKYTDFDTSAKLFFLQGDVVLPSDNFYGYKQMLNRINLSKVKQENIDKVGAYADKLYNDNKREDYTKGQFTWDVRSNIIGWLYYNGLVLESFLMKNYESYRTEVKKFYDQHIKDDGTINNYTIGELDGAMPSVGIVDLVTNGNLTDEELAKYNAAINYTYQRLEEQTIYPEAGNLWLHSQKEDGSPRKAWEKWNICLDGIYMSQLFLIRLTEAIDTGKVQVINKNGDVVKSSDLWNDIYSRFTFVMENMRDSKTGLIYHGYSVADKTTNGVFWSRGIGWYAMAFVEAAEKMPNVAKRNILRGYYDDLMHAVANWQDKETFLWYNVTNKREEVKYTKTTDEGEKIIYNIPESSGSGMLAYCLLRGYKDGLLSDNELRLAGLRAFNSLVETKMSDEGLLDIYRSSSVTTNPDRYQVNDYVINEAKGIGPLIMTSIYVD